MLDMESYNQVFKACFTLIPSHKSNHPQTHSGISPPSVSCFMPTMLRVFQSVRKVATAVPLSSSRRIPAHSLCVPSAHRASVPVRFFSEAPRPDKTNPEHKESEDLLHPKQEEEGSGHSGTRSRGPISWKSTVMAMLTGVGIVGAYQYMKAEKENPQGACCSLS